MNKNYPFPYFGHSLGSLNDIFDAYIWFKKEPDEKERKDIEVFLNQPDLKYFFNSHNWFGPHLRLWLNDKHADSTKIRNNPKFDIKLKNNPAFEGPIGFIDYIKNNPDFDRDVFLKNFPNEDELYERYKLDKDLPEIKQRLLAFRGMLDNILINLHQKYPLLFFLNVHYARTKFSPWHQWSLKNSKPVFEVLEHYFKNYIYIDPNTPPKAGYLYYSHWILIELIKMKLKNKTAGYEGLLFKAMPNPETQKISPDVFERIKTELNSK